MGPRPLLQPRWLRPHQQRTSLPICSWGLNVFCDCLRLPLNRCLDDSTWLPIIYRVSQVVVMKWTFHNVFFFHIRCKWHDQWSTGFNLIKDTSVINHCNPISKSCSQVSEEDHRPYLPSRHEGEADASLCLQGVPRKSIEAPFRIHSSIFPWWWAGGLLHHITGEIWKSGGVITLCWVWFDKK